MLVIKLRRVGKKHQAAFRVVVLPKRSKLDGKFIEDLGWFDPHSHAASINKDRVSYWLHVGAKSTPTVHNLFVSNKIIEGKKIPAHSVKQKKEEKK